MSITFDIPEMPDSGLYCFVYSAAVDKALNEDVTLGEIVDRAEIRTKVKDLYNAYHNWCIENSEHIASERYLALRMQEIGFERARTAETRYWKGIGIRVENK